MSGAHPSEETLQQYVLDRACCQPGEIGHIESCPDCLKAVGAYRLLTGELEIQPLPEFDFDLAAVVIRRIELARANELRQIDPIRERKRSTAGMAALILLVIGIPAWLFWKSAYFVFTDMSADFYWVLLAAAGIVVGLFVFRLYKKYQDVINLINK
ncbi:MAG TPA: hypothetical protein VG101_00880 [Puia sp.]|jgi:hypothetical protein|nr:hypothetical protein [Puia sp.]